MRDELMKSVKRPITEGIELKNQDRNRMLGERKITNISEPWKRTPSNKGK